MKKYKMKKNKKAPGNGFYYFMLFYREKQGRSCQGLKDISDEAGVHWKNMTPEQKQPFEENAKRDKCGIKYTSINESIDLLKKEDMARIERENDMRTDIKNTVARSLELGRLADTSFYLIHINDFFFCRSENKHYPAEIATLRFNLNYGVLDSNIYHILTKPGKFPLGYAAEAMDRARETHQLTVPFGDDSCNFDAIMHDLHQFLKVDFDAASASYPPFYTPEKEFAKVDNILDFLCDDYGYVRQNFKLYETEQLLYNLRNREDIIWPSISNAKIELEKDPYNFTTGIGCETHETSEIGYHCSRSYVVRTAFTICDCVCPEMGIELIAGQHVPANTAETLRQIKDTVSRSASVVASGPRNPDYYAEDGVSVKSAATGSSKDKTAYSVASSVYNDFDEIDTEDSISQSDAWNKVSHSRHNKNRPQQSQWPTLSGQSTFDQPNASQESSLGAAAAGNSAIAQTVSQGSTQGIIASASGSQMRRPTSVSVALQFRNLKLPSSGVATVGSTTDSRRGSSVTKGRGRASVIFNKD